MHSRKRQETKKWGRGAKIRALPLVLLNIWWVNDGNGMTDYWSNPGGCGRETDAVTDAVFLECTLLKINGTFIQNKHV